MSWVIKEKKQHTRIFAPICLIFASIHHLSDSEFKYTNTLKRGFLNGLEGNKACWELRPKIMNITDFFCCMY